jgi:hypothetical protein
MSKYNARKVEIKGIVFDSKAEARRFEELDLLETAHEILNLTIHPRFVLVDPFTCRGKKERGITYIADFRYIENGKAIVEDVKGIRTEAYKIKRKLFLQKYPEIEFREITG